MIIMMYTERCQRERFLVNLQQQQKQAENGSYNDVYQALSKRTVLSEFTKKSRERQL